jgi:redox-sensitive bicupin YhaK (pirin superfamily)
MIVLRPSHERGRSALKWLDSYHSFSFAHYRDPAHMGFRALRVINDDRLQPGHGFGRHPHRDMEIVSYIVSGELAHEDSLGNSGVLGAGDVQGITAGTGVSHDERNPSADQPVHFLQIWLRPERNGLAPAYEQAHFTDEEKRGRLRLVASRDGREGSVTVHQDAELHAALLEPGQAVAHPQGHGRHAWVQVIRGLVDLNDRLLSRGDGAAISDEREIHIAGRDPAEIVLFDLA